MGQTVPTRALMVMVVVMDLIVNGNGNVHVIDSKR